MSRLIDANKLPYEDIECTNGRTYMVVNAYDIENTPTVKAIPLDKVKQAREEINHLYRYFDNDCSSSNKDSMFKCCEVLVILDKLIAESEEK